MSEVPLAPDSPPPSRHAVTFVLITVLLDMIGFGIIMPVLPRLIEDVGHMDLAAAAFVGGWMFVAFSGAQFLFSPLMGNLSDRFGRRPLLLMAVFGLGVDYILSALAPNLWWLFLGRVLAGVCGSSWVIANAAITDITAPEQRARAFALIGAAFGLGFVIGPAVGGLLGEFGPRVPFWVAAAISAANFVYGWFVLKETLPRERRRAFDLRRANPFGTLRVFRRYPGVLPLCGVVFLYAFFSAVYPATWAFWGMAKFGWSEAMVGLTLAVFGLITAGFQAGLAGPVVGWLGERRAALAGLVIGAIAAFGYGLAGSFLAVMVLVVFHAPEGLVNPVLQSMLSRAVPEDGQGELQGGLAAIGNIAMLTGTLVLSQVFGYFMGPAVAHPTPDMAYYVAGVGLGVTALLFRLTQARAARGAENGGQDGTV